MKGTVIGIIGKAGSGKDSLFRHLAKMYGAQKAMFSYKLKRLVCEEYGYDFDQLDDIDYKEEQDPNLPDGWTRRRVLQFVGTDCFRAINPLHWVDKTMPYIDRLFREGAPAVVATDIRFVNEAEAIRDLPQGYLWRVVCTDTPTQVTGDAAAHVSETELDRIVPHVTLKAAFGKLPELYAQGDLLFNAIAAVGR
jgi:hypothetical protein